MVLPSDHCKISDNGANNVSGADTDADAIEPDLSHGVVHIGAYVVEGGHSHNQKEDLIRRAPKSILIIVTSPPRLSNVTSHFRVVGEKDNLHTNHFP